MGRVLHRGKVGALALAAALFLARTVSAGPREHTVPEQLPDEPRDAPTDAQAKAAARAFLRSVATERIEDVVPLLAIPFVVFQARDGRGSTQARHCFNNKRWVDEREAVPGVPQCLFAGLGPHATPLYDAEVGQAVFPTLAALESATGAVTAPVRNLLLPLRHHRFFVARYDAPTGAARVVLTLRRDGGRVTVDAIVATLPPR